MLVVILSDINAKIILEENYICDSSAPINGINKIVIENNKLIFMKIDSNQQTLFIVEKANNKQHYVPGVGNYEQFKNIPYVWDFADNNLWAINGCHVLSESIYCHWVIGELLKIPLKDTSIWDNRRLFEYKDLSKYLSNYELNSLPITMVFLEKYGRKVGKLVSPFYAIKDSLIQNTYFGFFLSSNNEPTYFLLSGSELSIWKHIESKLRNQWILYRKYNMPRFMKFKCFEKNKELYILMEEGTLYKAGKENLEKVKQLSINNFDDQILIVDKDNNQIKLLNKNNLTSLENLEKVINAKSINLF